MRNSSTRHGTLAVLTASLLTANLALADSELWIGNPGVTTTTNWSDTANWFGPSHNPNNNSVFFGNGVAVGTLGEVNNVVDKSTNCYSLNYTNSTGFNTTFIADGQTLTIVGNNGGPALLLTPNAQVNQTNTITGANGILLITGSSAGGISVTDTNSGGTGLKTMLDLSGLGTLIISNASSTAALNVGNTPFRPGATLNLAMTNYISLTTNGTGGSAAIVVGEATSNNGSTPGGVLNLGITNTILAGNIGVGLAKQSAATIQFNPAFLANNPAAYIRGPGGSAVTNWAIGDGIAVSGGSTTPGGTVNLNGGTVNALVSAMWLGKPSGTSSGSPTGKGTLSFSGGTFTVVNLTNGCQVAPSGSGVGGVATGIINVSGTGTLAVNNLVLASLATSSAGSSSGTLNVTNGTVAAGTIVPNGGVSGGDSGSYINLVGGTLYLTNTAGTAAQPLTSLYVSNATVQLNVTGSIAPSVATFLYVDGTTNLINVASIPATAVYPTQYPLIASTVEAIITSFNFGLGTLPGSYQGYISNNTANSSVDLVITNSQLKTDYWNGKASGIVNGNWNTTTLNWLVSGSPAGYLPGDNVIFDDTLTGTSQVVLATNVTPLTITFNNVNTNYVLSGPYSITCATALTLQGSGTVTLTESGGDSFNGGITVGSGVLLLDDTNGAIAGPLTINGGTVQIGNSDNKGALPAGATASININDSGVLAFNRTDNVTVATNIAGAGSLVQEGAGTLTLNNANPLFTGNTDVSGGTLALSGSGTLSNSAAVSVNNATFSVSGLSQPTTLTSLSLSNATLNVALNASLAANIDCTTYLFLFGISNYVNVASVPSIASYPVTFPIVQASYGISSYSPNGFNVAVTNLPSANPPYAATVTESSDQTTVLLTLTSGPTNLRSGVFWIGADVPSNFNWSDRLNWQLPGAPVPGDNVIFTPTAALTYSAITPVGGGASGLYLGDINNIVDGDVTIASLTFTNVSGLYHNTWINNTLTLGLTNALTVGGGSSSADFGNTATEFVTIAGTNGTLLVNNTNGTVFVGLGTAISATGSQQATLDLSALGTFNANISRMLVGVGGASAGIGLERQCGIVYLAQTNTIVASLAVSSTETSDTSASAIAFGVGEDDGDPGPTCYLYLGETNAIFADSICVAREKQSARMLFNPTFTSSSVPSAYFRGRSGGRVATWSLGDGVVNSGSSVAPTGVIDFTGGTVDARISTMYIGRAPNSTTGSGTSTGTLSFDGGVINVGTIYAGLEPTNNANKHGVGTINVVSNNASGTVGTLIVTGSLNLGFNRGGSGSESSSGTLNLTNGVVEANSISAGTNTPSAINIAGGTLVVTNPVAGPSAPLGTLTLAPLGIPGNNATALYLPVRTNSTIPSGSIDLSGVTVSTLNIDGLSTTTNIINIESVGPVGAVPVELPLIAYNTLNIVGGVFNIGLGPLPTGYTGYLTNDTTLVEPAIALVLTTAVNPQPRITAFSLQSGTNLVVSGVNGYANIAYAVLTSTNVALPLANWTSLGSGLFSPDGSFSFSATLNAATPQQYFRLQVLP